VEALISLVVLSLFVWFVWWAIDSSGQVKTGYGIIVKKEFVPAHTTITTQTHTQYHTVGNQTYTTTHTTPQVNYVPDAYSLQISVDRSIGRIYVKKDLYNSIDEGSRVCVRYSEGRLSKNLYLKEVRYP
jgi:phosphoribosylformylglycinamidine (FGAM) synthase-like amidotransferase family enzyme